MDVVGTDVFVPMCFAQVLDLTKCAQDKEKNFFFVTVSMLTSPNRNAAEIKRSSA